MPVPIVAPSSDTRNSDWLRILTGYQLAGRLRPTELHALWRTLPPRLRVAELPPSELGPVRPYPRHMIAAAYWLLDLAWTQELLSRGERARPLLGDFQRRYFPRPVHRGRRSLVNQAVEERASEDDKLPAVVRKEANFENLRLALAMPGVPVPNTFSTLRRRFNELVTEDLLGEDWRRRARAQAAGREMISLEELEAEPTGESGAEAELAAELGVLGVPRAAAGTLDLEAIERWLVCARRCTPNEASCLAGEWRGESTDEVAERFGVKPSTVRVWRHRGRQKLPRRST